MEVWRREMMKIAGTSPMNINRLSSTVEHSSMVHDERVSVAGREIWDLSEKKMFIKLSHSLRTLFCGGVIQDV